MPTTTSLKESAQTFRDKATKMLKLVKINDYLKKIFNVTKAISDSQENLETLDKNKTNAEKITARAEYKMSKLDENDPDYQEKKEKAKKVIETETDRQTKELEYIEIETKEIKNYIEDRQKRLIELEGFIEKVESGEIKISITEVNDLAGSLIMKS